MFAANGNDADRWGKTMAKVDLTEEQQRIQDSAAELARQIKEKTGKKDADGNEIDYNKVEYIGVVYRDGDKLKISQLYTKNDEFSAPWEKAFKEAGGEKNIVAVVHNHPKAIGANSGNQSDTDQANKLPSDNDWKLAETKFKDRSDVALYILGPDDYLRKYENTDRAKWLREWGDNPNDGDGYAPSLGPVVKVPKEPPRLEDPRTPEQASTESRQLYAQASSRQLPSMEQHSPESRQQMAAYAACVAAERGWDGVVGVGLNNATATQRGGELLCIAGKSSNPDPHANGVAVPVDVATAASPGQWLAKADVARDTLAQSQAQAQSQQQTQDQTQSQGQNQTLTLSRF